MDLSITFSVASPGTPQPERTGCCCLSHTARGGANNDRRPAGRLPRGGAAACRRQRRWAYPPRGVGGGTAEAA